MKYIIAVTYPAPIAIIARTCGIMHKAVRQSPNLSAIPRVKYIAIAAKAALMPTHRSGLILSQGKAGRVWISAGIKSWLLMPP